MELCILYDPDCSLCIQVTRWLATQPQLERLWFLPIGSPKIGEMFPSLERRPEELVVIGSGGEVWRDTQAWVMCLWALEEYRPLSRRFAKPRMLPFVRRLFQIVSKRRKSLSWVFKSTDDEFREALCVMPEPYCEVTSRPTAQEARGIPENRRSL